MDFKLAEFQIDKLDIILHTNGIVHVYDNTIREKSYFHIVHPSCELLNPNDQHFLDDPIERGILTVQWEKIKEVSFKYLNNMAFV